MIDPRKGFKKDEWDVRIAAARKVKRPKKAIRTISAGRCFYCGFPVREKKKHTSQRDWIILKPLGDRGAFEHKLPIVRGGTSTVANMCLACFPCNNGKGSLTADEFRFRQGLRVSDLNFRFAGESPVEQPRDWLCVNSAAFERGLMIHNFPDAAVAYALRNGWVRSWKSRQASR